MSDYQQEEWLTREQLAERLFLAPQTIAGARRKGRWLHDVRTRRQPGSSRRLLYSWQDVKRCEKLKPPQYRSDAEKTTVLGVFVSKYDETPFILSKRPGYKVLGKTTLYGSGRACVYDIFDTMEDAVKHMKLLRQDPLPGELFWVTKPPEHLKGVKVGSNPFCI